jgi:hypothetical protein
MSEQAPGRQSQLLHFVPDGALTEPGTTEFRDCDDTPMRNFIVHLHRLLDPESPGRAVR